ncbi:iron-containing alcohol dehydrogenase family protein [Lactobacillus sp. CC-MHH1034]|uniref:iron-containing alcohol dehydrogenase family protein n=1 Tax=Agrilactobacillus fermenti TaxID=2586909 RepID=UPI001E519C5D|nr:iron-containing alcohol dehydrogenase family protein [Agrilactobacillus fermenti]MCD2257227.1 iron-containing alcohol dehydrogenase family protein [Agrilactobacillus fermenti]
MNSASELRPGANRYVSGDHILDGLEDYLKDFGTCAVITGNQSLSVFENFYQKTLPYQTYLYDGTASDENGQVLAEKIGQVDTIIGIGGGRLLDTAKVTAENLKANFVSIPTLISNCAPYTPIGAIYHPDHTFKRVAYFKKAPDLTLVDWTLLLQTPKAYLVAGIGDTLAKWYEIEGLTRKLDATAKTAFIRLGIASAKEILNILLNDASVALASLAEQQSTPAFGRIADTVIGLAGTVGGFAAEYGRMAGAHAVHNGLSYIEATHKILHGNKVAYGILVQLAYTGDYDEIRKLKPFYDSVGLPTNLSGLDVAEGDQANLQKVAAFAASDHESFKLLNPQLTSADVLEAIHNVEAIDQQTI